MESPRSSDRPDHWFAAKRYGWGWGLPVRWEGWVVLAVYGLLFYAGIRYAKAERDPSSSLIYIAVITVVFVAIVAVKGERPLRWRWGKD